MPNSQSSPTPGVSPALSAEEWQARHFDRAGDEFWLDRDWVYGDGPDRQEECVIVEGGYGTTCGIQHRHALAALALHGQAFGFTHKDVRFLREEAEETYQSLGESPFVVWANNLADRIAALLPPSDTTGARE